MVDVYQNEHCGYSANMLLHITHVDRKMQQFDRSVRDGKNSRHSWTKKVAARYC